MINIESCFYAAMRDAGIDVEATIVADGKLHRAHVEGDKNGSVNAWYVLHDGAHPAGAFGCNKRGISDRWRADKNTTSSRSNPIDIALIEARRKVRATEAERAYSDAAKRAGQILSSATVDAHDHAYIRSKSIKPFGVNQTQGGVLIVPVFDARTGKLQSLQFIHADGQKRFLANGRTVFGCFPLRHDRESFKRALPLRIGLAEGVATAASIARVLSGSTALFATFSASNLINVATALREQYPTAQITIYGDNDASGVGQDAATKAATAVNGFVAIPAEIGTDWNDAARASA